VVLEMSTSSSIQPGNLTNWPRIFEIGTTAFSPARVNCIFSVPGCISTIGIHSNYSRHSWNPNQAANRLRALDRIMRFISAMNSARRQSLKNLANSTNRMNRSIGGILRTGTIRSRAASESRHERELASMERAEIMPYPDSIPEMADELPLVEPLIGRRPSRSLVVFAGSRM